MSKTIILKTTIGQLLRRAARQRLDCNQTVMVATKSWLAFGLLSAGLVAQTNPYSPPYTNSGNNLNGFIVKYGPPLTTDGTNIIGMGGGWSTMPVEVTGAFIISYQVYGDSGDVDSHFLLIDDTTNGGIDLRASPEGTDTPSINIFSGIGFYPVRSVLLPESRRYPGDCDDNELS